MRKSVYMMNKKLLPTAKNIDTDFDKNIHILPYVNSTESYLLNTFGETQNVID